MITVVELINEQGINATNFQIIAWSKKNPVPRITVTVGEHTVELDDLSPIPGKFLGETIVALVRLGFNVKTSIMYYNNQHNGTGIFLSIDKGNFKQ